MTGPEYGRKTGQHDGKEQQGRLDMSHYNVLYLNRVDSQCEKFGISHAIAYPFTSQYSALCGADLSDYNRTGNPTPRTQLCPRCKRLVAHLEVPDVIR